MKVVITNVRGEFVQQVADFLENEAKEWIEVTDVTVEDYRVSFALISQTDPFPEDYQMRILTNMFSGSGLEFLVEETDFCWTIA